MQKATYISVFYRQKSRNHLTMTIKTLSATLFFSCILTFAYAGNPHVPGEAANNRHLITNEKIPDKVIKGKVTDQEGNPLAGVSVTVKGTNTGTTTDDEGNYTLTVADEAKILVFSFVGYDSEERPIKGNNIDISLNQQQSDLDEVVVVGYGEQKKISLVGAQSQINATELKKPVANLSTMLAGRVSGVVGVQRTGLPGSNTADIWIRGISTFGGSSSGPLIIIDGVEGRSIDNLDPEDIESFTILKDATATAVYGARGANGVIIINTKRGKEGKVSLMANYMEGMTQFTKVPEMADAEMFMDLKNEALVASGFAPMYSQDYIDSTLDPTANHYVYPNSNWMDMLFRKASHNRRVNFSANGGNESTRFYSSVSYYEESSLLKTDALQTYDAQTKYQRYNFVSNVDMKWTKTTQFFLGVNGYISYFNEPGSGAGAAFSQAMSAGPVRYPAMYPGNLVSGIAEGSNPSPNPWAAITQTGYQENFQSQISSTIRLKQDLSFLLKGLSANGQYSFDTRSTSEQDRTRKRSTYFLNQGDPYNPDGSLNLEQVIAGSDDLTYAHSSSQARQFTLQGQVNWSGTFGNHDVGAMIVYNQFSQPNPEAGSYQDAIPTRRQDVASRITYGYSDKYFVEFDAGYTGSQVFAPQHRYAFFPSLGFGWVLSKEDFFQPLTNVFNFFKLRYSNGYTGAIGGTRFDYMTTITQSAKGAAFGTVDNNRRYDGVNILHYGADVRWAKSHDQDVGVEFNVLNNRLTFVLDWFRKYRTGIFLERANFPGFAGLQYRPDGNFGKTINTGFDATVELRPIPITEKFSVAFRGTFTYNRDKLLENGAAPYEEIYMDPRGQKILNNYGWVAEGLFQSEKEIANHADQAGVGGAPRVGDIMYKDLNGDGVVNDWDQTYIGNGDVAPLTFGVGVNFQYGNFYLSAFFQGVQGADRVISGTARSPFANAENDNVFAKATDRWTEENPVENPFYPRLAYGRVPNANNNVSSTWWVKDISFVRFKTLDFGYNMPNEWFGKTGFRDGRIYFNGVNLFYWSPFKLWDPEMNTGNGNTYPNTRNLAIGIQVHFN